MPRNLSLKIFASETSKVTTISDGGLFLDISSIQMFDANGAAVTDSSVVVTVGVSADGVAYQSKVVSSDSSLGGFDFKYIKLSASGHTIAASVVVNLKVCGIDEAMSDRQYKGRLAELFTVKPYSAATLPASLPAGASVVVDGKLVEYDANGVPVLVGAKSRRVSVASTRIFGAVGKDTTAGRTAHLIMQAPAHYDAVRINVLSAESAGNAWKVTVAPSAKYNTLGPVDASDVAITPTVVTFGTTDRKNPRNPGGGAVTVTSTGASGTAAAHNLIQDRIVSDLIQIKSLDRVDYPAKNPLIYVRVYGANIPLLANAVMADNDANALKNVLGEYYSGYANGDYSLTNPENWSQYGAPCVEIEFLLRGKVVRNIGITGDSTDQGWIDSTAVPQFGATINGYMRRVVKYLRDNGEPVGYSVFAQAGQRSFMTYNNALSAVISGELTHLVIRPWSVNDHGTGTTAAVANDAIQRTNLLIQACFDYGVVPILLRPFAYGSFPAAALPLIHSYVDSYKASGGLVLDFTSVVNVSGSLVNVKPEFLTVNSGGSTVDPTHLNDAGHQAIADDIIAHKLWLFS